MDRTGRRRTRCSPRSSFMVYPTRMLPRSSAAAVALACTLGLTAGCAPAPRSGPAPRPGAAPAAAPRDSLAGPWALRNAGRPRAAVIVQRAELRSRVDSTWRVDSVASRTALEWSVAVGRVSSRVLGMVRSFELMIAGDSGWRAPAGLQFPVTFAASIEAEGAQPHLELSPALLCEARGAAVQAFRETWLAAPPLVQRGATWRDSTTYPLCRDGIPLSATVVRDYEVVGSAVRDGALVLEVQRRSRSQLSGRGVQFGDTVQVAGQGAGDATLFVSPDCGAVVTARGQSVLRLELRGRRRTQELVQTGALEIFTP